MNPSPHLLDTRLRQLSRRRALGRVLGALGPRLAATLAIACAAVVVARLALPQAADWLWLAPALAAALPLLTLPRALRAPPRARLAADLDLLAHGEGLVMALAAQAPADRDPAWTERLMRRLEAVALPPVPWRALGPPIVAAAAVAGAFALPQRLPEPPPERPPVAGFFDEARRRLDALAARGLLPEPQRAELERQIERLEAEAARTGMSQAAWDGLDRVDEQARATATQATRRLAEAMVAAERARGLTVDPPAPETPELVDPDDPDADDPERPEPRSRLKRKPKEPEPSDPDAPAARASRRKRLLERLTRESDRKALQRFARGLGELAEAAPDLIPRLDDAMLDELDRLLEALGPDAGLTPEQLEALRRAAGGQAGQGGQGGQGGARPMTQDELDELVEALRRRLQGEADGLDGTEHGQRLAVLLQAMRQLAGGDPGRGGGPAPLTRDGRPAGPAGQVTALPPGLPDDGDGSVTLAVETRAPELDDAARRELVRAAAQAMDPARADARRAHVAPRHKAVVGRYFEAGAAPAPAPAPQPE